MFLDFLVFEIKLRLKSISTYCFFALWVLLMFLFVGASNYTQPPGKVLVNRSFVTRLFDFQLSFSVPSLWPPSSVRRSSATSNAIPIR
jgi:ABC-2 type transport system permease protein